MNKFSRAKFHLFFFGIIAFLLSSLTPSWTFAGLVIPEPISVGMNKFDLFQQYLGRASGGDGTLKYQRMTQAMARKAMADAADIGATYFRVSATGYAPSAYGKQGDLDLWLKNRKTYWRLFDQMMRDMQAQKIRIIPTFAWNIAQLPAMTGENVTQLIKNPGSKSYRLLKRYIADFVTHYRHHPQLLFYELTNELNLEADLDNKGRCQKFNIYQELCPPKGNYSTDEMIAFTKRLAKVIRKLDPVHPISSGFSIARPGAMHLRMRPEWSIGGPDWTKDTVYEYASYVADVHEGVDIISAHLYAGKENIRFGSLDPVDLLEATKDIADQIGKPLFLGEFGDITVFNQFPGSFAERMLDKIVSLKIPYSALWIWEFYQSATYLTRNNSHTQFSLEPGYAENFLSELRQINQIDPSSLEISDSKRPRVLLTWPLRCQLIKEGQKLYAVASDDRQVERVEFWVNYKRIAVQKTPPYETTLNLTNMPYDLAIKVVAFDAAGNSSMFQSRVITDSIAGRSCR
jgi:hypothetical protein